MSIASESIFLPLTTFDNAVWETELDRIQVVEVWPREVYCIRLVGPGNSLNLHVKAAEDGSASSAMEFSTGPMPETSRDLIEYNAIGEAYFEDAYVPLRRRGLDKWIYYRPPTENLRYGSRSWTYCIIAHLTTQSAFRLEIASSSVDPLACLWDTLFLYGHDLRESTSHCSVPDEEQTIWKEREWQSFQFWREGFVFGDA